jgi:hypothetical protein
MASPLAPQSPIDYASLDSMEGIAAIGPTTTPSWLDTLPRGRLVHAVYPGLLAAATIAMASTWLASHYTAPVMLFALLFGMAFHFLYEGGRCVAGIEFASRSVLRLGVALLGVRITYGQIASLGPAPVATVIVGVATTVLIGLVLARRLSLTPMFGVLSGGSVAICGASAALAIASVLPKDKDRERDTILVVVTVTALSTLAMILYPVFAASIGLDHKHAGVFIGGTIHDVAQVVGAGYMISPETGDRPTSSSCGSRCCCRSSSRSRSPSRAAEKAAGREWLFHSFSSASPRSSPSTPSAFCLALRSTPPTTSLAGASSQRSRRLA